MNEGKCQWIVFIWMRAIQMKGVGAEKFAPTCVLINFFHLLNVIKGTILLHFYALLYQSQGVNTMIFRGRFAPKVFHLGQMFGVSSHKPPTIVVGIWFTPPGKTGVARLSWWLLLIPLTFFIATHKVLKT